MPVALWGQGGIGKTQIALQYARRHESSYSAIIWLDGTSQESLRRTFRQFATQLKGHYDRNKLSETSIYPRLAYLSQPVSEHSRSQDVISVGVILDWLNLPDNNEWLLVYDNVDDIDSFDIRNFFPEASRGTIIITSRRPESARLGIGLEVDVLSDEDGLELLHKTRNFGQTSDEGTHESI